MRTRIGTHAIEVEEDCLIVRLQGDFTLPDMVQWCQAADEVIAKHGYMLLISDFRNGKGFSAEARRYGSSWPNAVRMQGTAIFGASLVTTVIITMLGRAILLLKKHAIPTIALKTEADAHAWIEGRRQVIYATLGRDGMRP